MELLVINVSAFGILGKMSAIFFLEFLNRKMLCNSIARNEFLTVLDHYLLVARIRMRNRF